MPIGVYHHKPRSEKTKKQISLKLKGIKRSDETKKKMSDKCWLKGKHIKTNNALETWRKNGGKSKGNTGHIPWNKGIKSYVKPWLGKKRSTISGKNCHFWKGGITTINDRIRTSLEYKIWRKAIFERDKFICQKTGISGGFLHAHHINNFSEKEELRLAIDNGITLSKKSHEEFHKLYGRKNNTLDQLKEFLCVQK